MSVDIVVKKGLNLKLKGEALLDTEIAEKALKFYGNSQMFDKS